MSEQDKLREAIRRASSTSAAMGILGAASTYTVHYADWLKILAAAESTLPKTRMVEVWRVEWSFPDSTGQWKTYAFHSRDEVHAKNRGWAEEAIGARCIRVTGPHLQEVPA